MLPVAFLGALVVALLWPRPEPKRSAGAWVPKGGGKLTAKQWAVIDKAHRSSDPHEVLSAYYLARDLGFDDGAEVLSRRHAALIMRIQEQYPPPVQPSEYED